MKILKKGGSREKGEGGNEIHAPCACVTARKCKSLNVGPNGSNVKCVIQTDYNERKMD